jgi:hypothetical protein
MKTFAALLILATLAACTKEDLAQVRDVTDKRHVICEFVAKAEGAKEAKAACDAGKSLEEIAAAYAGCEAAQ